MKELRNTKILIRTHCVKCGAQIETELEIYTGKDFLNRDILKKRIFFLTIHILMFIYFVKNVA